MSSCGGAAVTGSAVNRTAKNFELMDSSGRVDPTATTMPSGWTTRSVKFTCPNSGWSSNDTPVERRVELAGRQQPAAFERLDWAARDAAIIPMLAGEHGAFPFPANGPTDFVSYSTLWSLG